MSLWDNLGTIGNIAYEDILKVLKSDVFIHINTLRGDVYKPTIDVKIN